MGTDYKRYVEAIINTWQGRVRTIAKQLIKKYGYPDEASSSRCIWYRNGCWKKTIIHRDAVPYLFLGHHSKVLEQTIIVPNIEEAVYIEVKHAVINRESSEITLFGENEEANFEMLGQCFKSHLLNRITETEEVN